MELKADISRLKALETNYKNQRFDMGNIVEKYPQQRDDLEILRKLLEYDWRVVQSMYGQNLENPPVFHITLQDNWYQDKTETTKALEVACAEFKKSTKTKQQIGELHGFKIELQKDKITGEINAVLYNKAQHFVEFGISTPHNLRKLESTIMGIGKRFEETKEAEYKCEQDHRTAVEFLETPFKHADELKAKTERHGVLQTVLNKEAADRQLKEREGANEPPINYFSREKREAFSVAHSARSGEKQPQEREKKAEKEPPDRDDDDDD
jgi:hypothetical protein